jgi:chemotaxis protein methyltransferase CheR
VQRGAFFGEPGQLELLANSVLPELGRRRRRLRLWSAGCGTGEVAWSLAMTVAEARLPEAREGREELEGLEVEIIATDADPAAVARAAEAVYPEAELRQVSAARRRRHFVRGVGPRDGLWRVIAPLRDQVELYALDLAGPWPAGPAFDVVFAAPALARLVPAGARQLAGRFAEVLAPGGALFVGGALDLGDVPGLVAWRPGVYRRRTG